MNIPEPFYIVKCPLNQPLATFDNWEDAWTFYAANNRAATLWFGGVHLHGKVVTCR